MAANTILVFSERPGVLRELLGKARQQADSLGWTVAAAAPAQGAVALGEAGADVVYQITGDIRNPETTTDFLAAAFRQAQPAVVLIGATKLGMEVAPRLADRQGLGYAAWVVGFEVDAGTLTTTAHSMLYTGTGLATYRFKPGTAILTAAPGVFEARATPGKTANVLPLEAPTGTPRITILGEKPKPASGIESRRSETGN